MCHFDLLLSLSSVLSLWLFQALPSNLFGCCSKEPALPTVPEGVGPVDVARIALKHVDYLGETVFDELVDVFVRPEPVLELRVQVKPRLHPVLP